MRHGRVRCRRAPQLPSWDSLPELNRQLAVRMLGVLAARMVMAAPRDGDGGDLRGGGSGSVGTG
jgi:hypothetical protein